MKFYHEWKPRIHLPPLIPLNAMGEINRYTEILASSAQGNFDNIQGNEITCHLLRVKLINDHFIKVTNKI
jgi:hypothetical protein